MPDTPTFGRYAEIPYDQMTPEQQEGYRVLKEVRGQVGGPSKIWVHNPKLAKAIRGSGFMTPTSPETRTPRNQRRNSKRSKVGGSRPRNWSGNKDACLRF
jgi:hypothetical protein